MPMTRERMSATNRGRGGSSPNTPIDPRLLQRYAAVNKPQQMSFPVGGGVPGMTPIPKAGALLAKGGGVLARNPAAVQSGAAGMPNAALTPLAPTSYTPAYGGKPGTPNPIATAGGSIAGNIGNLGGIYRLAGGLNQFQTRQALGQLQQNLPGYNQMVNQSSQNINQELAGQVPQDVINQIMQSAAERGVATGGGPNSNAAFLRALGLTSIGQMQTGEQNLTGAIGRTPRPDLVNPGSFLVSPGDQQSAATHAADVAAAPDPAAAERAREAAALRGIGAGAGSVGGVPPRLPGGGYPTSWGGGGGGPNEVLGMSTGTGLTMGGVTQYPGGSADPGAAWQQWASGLFHSPTQGQGDDLGLFDSDLNFGDIAGTGSLPPETDMGNFDFLDPMFSDFGGMP